MAKKKVKKVDPIYLTSNQVMHLIYGTIRNLIDLQVHYTDTGYHFLLILDCVIPDGCIGVREEPETDEEILDILCAHSVPELSEYFDNILSVSQDGETFHRAFSTVEINADNLAAFVDALSDLDLYWEEIDQEIRSDADLKEKIKGKNFVEGNGTVN
jgi:hypothetical protein